jgi:hypothetical protein
MRANFGIGLPEAAGLSILGGTVGALICGAGADGLSLFTILGGVAGAAIPMAIVVLPRLLRLSGRV